MASAFQRRALRKASRILGSHERLREMLDAPQAGFGRWIEGEESMPIAYFGMVLDFLADMEALYAALPPSANSSAGVRAP